MPSAACLVSPQENLMMHKLDTSILLAMTVFGSVVGSYFILTTNNSFFYQTFTPETVMWACHQGFVYPTEKPQALLDFLSGRSSDFNCQALNAVTQTQRPGLFARLQLYLTFVVATSWRLMGVSYANLWPAYAMLHGAYAAGCFFLLRVFFGRWIATPAALALTISPIVIGMLFMLRDYSKAPFIIWTIVFLIVAIRSGSAQRAITASGVSGCILGVGTGFRLDVLVLLPVGIVFLGLGVKTATHIWRTRAAAIAAFGIGCALLAGPVVAASYGGAGALAMQGVTDPFVRFLGVGPAPYSLGWRYSDELTLSTIAADISRTDHNWDAQEGEPLRSVSQSITRSTGYFFNWAPLFAADFATHAIKSVLTISGFETLLSPQYLKLDPTGSRPLWFSVSMSSKTRLLLQVIGSLGLLALLFRSFARSPRQAACIAILFIFLLAYPGIQFSVRHFFHLEILSWMGVLSLLVLPIEWKNVRHFRWRFFTCVLGFFLMGAVAYYALITFQDRTLTRQITQLLLLEREPAATLSEQDSDGKEIWKVDIPSHYLELVSGPTDSLNSGLPEIGIEWDVRAAADRIIITIDGSTCAAGKFAITFGYQKRPDVFQPLDHAFTVIANPPQKTLLVAPAFYRPTQYLSEISVPSSQRGCISQIDRLLGDSQLPSSFTAVLSADWMEHSLHQTLWE